MTMKNGVYAARKTDNGIRGIFIDEEILEHNVLNRKAKENRRQIERAAARECETILREQERKAAVEHRKRRATARLVKGELKLLGAAGVVFLGEKLGLVDLAFAVPVLLAIQTMICFRAGKFFGRKRKSK